MINNNPFSTHRAEYMKNLWKYYVPFKDFPENVEKSIIVVGGRGTGKSMFFLCNSWREKYSELEISSDTPVNDFLFQKQIGIYYKVDSTFVGAMKESNPDSHNWDGYFNTYLSICLLIELIPLISLLHENGIIDMQSLNNIVQSYFSSVRSTTKKNASLDDMKEDCAAVLQEIEDILNYCSTDNISFRQTQPGTIFKTIVDKLHSINALSDIAFKVYIDEYESFSERQQKIVNTLIKQSNRDLIYNVGMRHNGMKTQSTLGENEILQPTHDFYFFNFDDLLVGQDYENVLKDICKKRFQMFFDNARIELAESYTNIEYYLATYSIANEIDRFAGRNFKFKKKLETLIREQCCANDDAENAVQLLCNDAPVLNARLHMAILMRAPHYRPSISKLCLAFQSWKCEEKNDNADMYRNWLHNAKNGLIYLLTKDCGISKWYYGFDTFAALSSGVVRYFLELCEQTFNIAMIEGFSWNNPQPITPDIQTRAAKYVSQYKVNEISSYPICGKRLRIFVQCFGEICRDLHRNENSTLGEPEVNHFTTESLQLSSEVESYLNEAVTWLVLQRLPQTKSKESLRTDILDYHLNKIYTPYFDISFNKKRKIKLDQMQLEQLFSSDLDIANKSARVFLDNYWGRKIKTNKANLKKAPANTGEQLNLFGEGVE